MSSPLIRDEIHVMREIEVLRAVPPRALTSAPEENPTRAASESSGTEGDEKWEWWQGYRKDRKLLGFEGTQGKNIVPVIKKSHKKKKRDDE
jgi:hypothetical protein